ncbi:hypothetical protein ACROYT_G007667 [Oculina patagonica]
MIVLILSVAVCKAAKFPFQLSSQDCDFCTDFMLEDCICEDVAFCKRRSCYVPDKCADVQCDDQSETQTEEEMPSMIQEPEIVPATATTLGNESEEECQYCVSMPFGCYCEDVDWCRGKHCKLPAQCDEECPLE